jgi:alpha-1,2-mannosyltransferase
MTTEVSTTLDEPARTRRPAAWQLALLAGIWLLAAWLHVWYGNRHRFYDLGIYADAMRWWAAGHDLYSFTLQDNIQGQLGFTYPPFAALILYPLAWMPFGVAEVSYVVLTSAALVVTTYWLLAPVARRHGWPRWYAVLLALPLISWLEPVRETFTYGQINMLLVILVLIDLLFGVPRKARWTGVGIGLATAIKLTPAVFIAYLLVTRRWRAAATATATAAGATLLAAAIAPRDSWRFWTGAIWDTGHIGHLERTANQSLLGTLARLSLPAQPNRLIWAVLALAVGGYGLWRARRAALAGDEVTGLTLAGLVSCVVSPITWTHHVYWFVPALIVLLDTGRRRHLGYAVLVYATVAFSVVSWFEWGLSERRWGHGMPGFLITNWYVLLMLALLAVIPIRAVTREQRELSIVGT